MVGCPVHGKPVATGDISLPERIDYWGRVEAVCAAFSHESPTVLLTASVAFAKRDGIMLAEMQDALRAAWDATTISVSVKRAPLSEDDK